MRRMSVEPCPCLASRCPLNGAGRAAGAIGANLPRKSYVARNRLPLTEYDNQYVWGELKPALSGVNSMRAPKYTTAWYTNVYQDGLGAKNTRVRITANACGF